MAIPKVIGENILVQKMAAPEKKQNGLIIPDCACPVQKEYVVLAIGNEVKDVAVGDTVIIAQYAGSEILHNNVKYLVMQYQTVLAILPKE